MKVLNFSVVKTIPQNAVYIGRNFNIWRMSGGTGKPLWGNEWIIGQHGTRKEVIAKHDAWLQEQIKDPVFAERLLKELDGKDLVCHCAPEDCHGHNYIRAIEKLRALEKDSPRLASAKESAATLSRALDTVMDPAFGTRVPAGSEPAMSVRPMQDDPYLKSGALDAMGRAFCRAFGETWGRLDADDRQHRKAAFHTALRSALAELGVDQMKTVIAPPSEDIVANSTRQYLIALNGPGADNLIVSEFQGVATVMREALFQGLRHHAEHLARQKAATPAAPSRAERATAQIAALFAENPAMRRTDAEVPAAGDTTHVAIIGTAGRRDDGSKISRPLYDAMTEHAREVVRQSGGKDKVVLVSGGAAVADHIAVRLFLEGEAKGLILHLPAKFDNGRFVETPNDRYDAGRTANWYHQQFRQRAGIDGLKEIAQAIQDPRCQTTVNPGGFKARNTDVAKAADVMIAYTFGAGRSITESGPGTPGHANAAAAGLKDGGTADTWGKATRAARKIHVPLDLLQKTRTAAPRQARTADQR